MLKKNRYQYNIKYAFKNYCQDIVSQMFVEQILIFFV